MRKLHTLSLFPFLLAGSALAQGTLHTITPPQPANGYWHLGDSFVNAGDVDHDGVDDLLVGRPSSHTVLGSYMGSAVVYSGKTLLPIHSIVGSEPSGEFGTSVIGLGDINLDGYVDFAVGAPMEDIGAHHENGVVRIYSGKDGQVLRTHNAPTFSSYTHFGYALASADVNLDGFKDLIVGAPGASDVGFHSGSVFVYSGYDGALLWTRTGDVDDENFGQDVHTPGDLNSDGRPDVLVYAGGIGLNSSAGGLFYYSGMNGALLYIKVSNVPYQNFGWISDGVGDINNNGTPDIAVGDPHVLVGGQMVGAFDIYAGSNGQLMQSVVGTSAGQGFGSSVCPGTDFNGDGFVDYVAGLPDIGSGPGHWGSGGGRMVSGKTGASLGNFIGLADVSVSGIRVCMGSDVDGDGVRDVVLGGPDYSNHDGILEIFSPVSKARVATIEHDARGTQLGTSVAILGDINHDGYADYIVGSAFELVDENMNVGAARVYSGKTGALMQTIEGKAKNDRCGYSVASLGDVNGDGFADFAIGTPGADEAALPDAGQVEVRSGKTGSVLYTIHGAYADQLGWCVASAGDVNHDGIPDIIIGAPFAIPNGLASGRAMVCSGQNGAILYQYNGTSSLMRLGMSVAGVGDINGDTYDDFILGVPGDPQFGTAAGAARVYSGKTGLLLTSVGEVQPGSQSGMAVCGGGDMNQDGLCEFVYGAPFYDGVGSDSGIVRVYAGKIAPGGSYSNLYILGGLITGEHYGAGLASPGDMNNDGRSDLAVASPLYTVFGIPQIGRVVVVSGLNGQTIESMAGSQANVNFGTAISGGGDIDADGFPDLLVSSPGDDSVARDAGLVTVFSLMPKGLIPFAFGTPGCHGAQVALAGTSPKVGNSNFYLDCSNTPPNSLSLGLVADNNTVQPEDPLGLGCVFWVDLVQSTEILTFDLVSDSTGYALAAAPIPNVPALAGRQYYYQAVSYWNNACPLGALSLSTSSPAVIKIQP